jgi:hypothetical protein
MISRQIGYLVVHIEQMHEAHQSRETTSAELSAKMTLIVESARVLETNVQLLAEMADASREITEVTSALAQQEK